MKTHTNFWTSMQQIPCKMRGHECLKYQHVANTIQNERLRCQTIWIPCKMTGSSSKLLQIQSNWHQERNQKKNKPYQTNLSHSSSLFLCQASHPSRSPRTSLSEVRNTMGLKSYNVFQHVKKSIGWHAYRCRITCCLCTWNSMSIYIWSRLSNYIMVFVVSLFQNHDTLVTAVTVFVYVCMYRIIFL